MVAFSIHLNRRVFVMYETADAQTKKNCSRGTDLKPFSRKTTGGVGGGAGGVGRGLKPVLLARNLIHYTLRHNSYE